MKRLFMLPILFALFLIETSIIPWVIPPEWQRDIIVAPHFVFVVIVMLSVFYGRHFAVVCGLVFGLIHDVIFYGLMLGLYASGMGIIAYLSGLFFFHYRPTMLRVHTAVLLSLITFDLYVFGIYRLFNITDYTFTWILLYQVIPSAIFNLFFSFVIYVPIRQLVEKLQAKPSGNEEESRG